MITNLSSVRAKHRAFLMANRHMIDRILADRGEEVHAHVREHATFRHRTGAALAGTSTRLMRTRSGTVLRITNTAKHGKFLEFGTKPHTIRARRAKALSFFWLRVSKAMMVRAVNHPGTRPYWFLRNAADHAAAQINPHLVAEMSALARKF